MKISRRIAGTAAIASFVAGSGLALSRAAKAQASTDSTFDRVKQGKLLRIAALPGESPYFNKNIATGEWTGMAVEMAKNIASSFDARIEYLESTYGNSVLDLESGKIDLAFALNPTPQRALVIGFSRPVFMHGFGCVAKKGFEPHTWGDLNRPELKIAVDIGSVHELAARNFAAKAQIIGLKSRDECVLAVQTGRADCVILAVILGLTAVKKNPSLGSYVVLRDPFVQLPNCMGVRYEVDKRWRDFLDNWADYNRGAAQIRKWMIDGLALNGVTPQDIPPEVGF